MNKLPFVWELNNKGIISHAIGSPHGLEIRTSLYTPEVIKYLQGKTCVLLEDEDEFHRQPLDKMVFDLAYDMDMPIRGLETIEESNYTRGVYLLASLTVLKPLSYDRIAAFKSYAKGDEEPLREVCRQQEEWLKEALEPIDYIQHCARNSNMAERSLINLTKPSLLIVGLAHLILEPSMLSMYQEKGIGVKRLQ